MGNKLFEGKELSFFLQNLLQNQVAFILGIENTGGRINSSAGLEQLHQQIKKIKQVLFSHKVQEKGITEQNTGERI